MKTTVLTTAVGLMLLGAGGAFAQGSAPTPTPTPSAVEAAVAAVGEETVAPFSQEALLELAAPVALYPDPLLLHVLIAAGQPLDVVRASRWLRENPDVPPEKRFDAVVDLGWDPSVIALTAFPDLLDRMARDLDWTEALGAAMILQEDDLLDAVQTLRALAQAHGALGTTEEQIVEVDADDTISITPAEADVIYVPVYDDKAVYSAKSPTVVETPATVVRSGGASTGDMLVSGLIGFGAGILVSEIFRKDDKHYDYYWGDRRPVYWGGGYVRPPYYRPPVGYRPPPGWRPPAYWRPGDAWRPRAELVRVAPGQAKRWRPTATPLWTEQVRPAPRVATTSRGGVFVPPRGGSEVRREVDRGVRSLGAAKSPPTVRKAPTPPRPQVSRPQAERPKATRPVAAAERPKTTRPAAAPERPKATRPAATPERATARSAERRSVGGAAPSGGGAFRQDGRANEASQRGKASLGAKAGARRG